MSDLANNLRGQTARTLLGIMVGGLLVACTGSPEGSSSNAASSEPAMSSTPALSSAPSSEAISSIASSAAPSSVAQVSSSSASSAPALVSITLEENAAGLCSYSGTVDSEHLGFNGPGFINTSNELGAGIIWAVYSAAAGNFEVTVRYANGGDGARGGELGADGSNMQATLTLGMTGAWANWTEERTVLQLVEGNNIVRLNANQASGLANIDAITFVGAGLAEGDCSEVVTGAGKPGDTFPANGASQISPDVHLQIVFDAPPTINNGVVTIYDTATGQVVDTIATGLQLATIGERSVNTYLINSYQNKLIINPRDGQLAYGKSYSVAINEGVITGKIQGQDFRGITRGNWQFSTKNTAPNTPNVTVDDDGAADFHSVQGALDFMMSRYSGDTSARVFINNGVYPELLHLTGKNNLTIIGESRDHALVRARNGNTLNNGTRARPQFLVQDSNNLTLENFTLHNTATRGGGDGQAEALFYDDNGRMIAKNMLFYSEQDTLLLNGYVWVYNSVVAGNVDFIWGGPQVALFENSEIRSIGDSNTPNSDAGGYVLQSRSPQNGLGFVFLNSTFTRGVGPAGNIPGNGKSALARGASKDTTFDSIAFINCKMDAHIRAEGFDPGRQLNPAVSSANLGYREYGSTTLNGSPIDLGQRYSVYRLTSSEYQQNYANRQAIFSAAGTNWNPAP